MSFSDNADINLVDNLQSIDFNIDGVAGSPAIDTTADTSINWVYS